MPTSAPAIERLRNGGGGRPKGRALSDLELQHLRLLLEVRTAAQVYAQDYDERLEDFVLALREQGSSTRTIAEALSVSPSKVQQWAMNAQRRREQSSEQ